MTTARSLLIAMAAVALLIGARQAPGTNSFARPDAGTKGGGQGGQCRIETRPRPWQPLTQGGG